MEHRIVSAIGPMEWSSTIGKKGSETSFTTYGVKKGDSIVSIVVPSKYPDKIWSLAFTLSLCDEVLLRVERIDRDLGETLIALDMMGKDKGFISVSDSVDRSILSRIIKDSVASRYQPFDHDPAVLREWLFDLPLRSTDGPTIVAVDQAFNVKGVGTVALGFVTSGKVRKHQELEVHPSGRKTQVRSIQIHDKDHDEGPNGSRVGLALKNISPDDLPRGSIMTEENTGYSSMTRLVTSVRNSPYWKGEMAEGTRLHLVIGLQFIPCTIVSIEDRSDGSFIIEIESESAIWSRKGERIALAFLDSKSFRLFASGETI